MTFSGALFGKGRACGKTILIGEHFVVHGKTPALALHLPDIYCEVKIELSTYPIYEFKTAREFKLGLDVDKEEVENLMARATYVAADCFRIDPKAHPLKVLSSANFPISRGFGSSASFAVALTRAFDQYRNKLVGSFATLQELESAMLSIEKVFHGKPSGLDTAVIFSERPVRFQAGAIVREFENNVVDFIVVDSGFRENCSGLISKVGEFKERNVEQWDKMSVAVTDLVDKLEIELKNGDPQQVAKYVSESHGILSELGLSSPDIENVISTAIDFGALGGKVSGAGGGGAVLLVTRLNQGQEVAENLKKKGFSVVSVLEGGKKLR